MKRKGSLLLIICLLVAILTACGAKSQTDVTKDLQEKVGKLQSYSAQATMTLQMGTEPQTYDVEVSYKKPEFYRVGLQNAKKEENQIILKNEEGVFVLTPALNKSFKFQNEWPKNSSQAYLYESLVQDILKDEAAVFSETEIGYVFETKTRYQNNSMLPMQIITFDKKELKPLSVKVLDTDRNEVVIVEFPSFTFDSSFDMNEFDVQKNMATAQLEVTVMAPVTDDNFAVMYPTTSFGAELADEVTVQTANGKRIVQTYEGENTFTLIQEKSVVMPTNAPIVSNGQPVDLGFAIGELVNQAVMWTYQGVDYTLASDTLTSEQLVIVAQTMIAGAEK